MYTVWFWLSVVAVVALIIGAATLGVMVSLS